MKTYSTQADLRAALKAMPINQLVARCVYYQLINGVTYKPNTRIDQHLLSLVCTKPPHRQEQHSIRCKIR